MADKPPKPTPPPPEPAQPTVLSDPHHVRQDAILAAQAARERWPMPARAREFLVAKALQQAKAAIGPREFVRIAGFLLAADELNFKVQKLEVENQLQPIAGPPRRVRIAPIYHQATATPPADPAAPPAQAPTQGTQPDDGNRTAAG